MILFFIFNFISNTFSLNLNNFVVKNVNLNDISVTYETYNSNKFKVYKPATIYDTKEQKNIIFYTGGNSIIPSNIYSNFLKILASYGYKIYAADTNSDINENLYDNLNIDTYVLGHSSGCMTALFDSNKYKHIEKAILMDPVKSTELLNKFNLFNKEDIKIKHLKNILLLNAEKSYKWTFFPKLNIPFIPAFSLKENEIYKLNNNVHVQKIEASDFGHCDILDNIYSDFMHNSLSKGNVNRDELYLLKYMNWLSLCIDNFINNNNSLKINILNEENSIIKKTDALFAP